MSFDNFIADTHSNDAAVRERACESLARVRDLAAIPRLIELLADPDTAVRWDAEHALMLTALTMPAGDDQRVHWWQQWWSQCYATDRKALLAIRIADLLVRLIHAPLDDSGVASEDALVLDLAFDLNIGPLLTQNSDSLEAICRAICTVLRVEDCLSPTKNEQEQQRQIEVVAQRLERVLSKV